MLAAYQEIAIRVHRPFDKRQVENSFTDWSKINEHMLFTDICGYLEV